MSSPRVGNPRVVQLPLGQPGIEGTRARFTQLLVATRHSFCPPVRLTTQRSYTRKSGWNSAATQRRIQKAWLRARSGVHLGRSLHGQGAKPHSQKKGIFRLKWRLLVNSELYFLKILGTVCIVASPTPISGGLVRSQSPCFTSVPEQNAVFELIFKKLFQRGPRRGSHIYAITYAALAYSVAR